MKPAQCHICGEEPKISTFPAGAKNLNRVAIIICCPKHLLGQFHSFGGNFAATHRATILAWNDYQDSMESLAVGEAP